MKNKGCFLTIIIGLSAFLLMGLAMAFYFGVDEPKKIEPIVNVKELWMISSDEFKEKYGEPDYVDSDYSLDGLEGFLYQYNDLGCDAIFNNNDNLVQLNFYGKDWYSDKTPAMEYEQEEDIFKLFGLDRESDEWSQLDNRNVRMVYYGDEKIWKFDYTKQYGDNGETGVVTPVRITFNTLYYE